MSTYIWRVSSPYTPSTTFDIRRTVDVTHVESLISPIDLFIAKNRELNALLIDPNNFSTQIDALNFQKKVSKKAVVELKKALSNPLIISPMLANLILLGHISAVESYFRAIFRKLVIIDQETQRLCYEKSLHYGAVLVHEKHSLPDALLEFISFSSKANIESTLKEFFGTKGNLPAGLANSLEEFNKICQLRHSIIHKFGTLGANNLKHDLMNLTNYINKPIKNDFSSIQDISLICKNVVLELNQLIWQTSMIRLIADYQSNKWRKRLTTPFSWKWSTDKKLFKSYFDLFFSTEAKPANPKMKDAYLDLNTTYNSL